MTVQEFNQLVDPRKQGTAWVFLYYGEEIEIKYNTRSEMLEDIEAKKVLHISAVESNVFAVKIER